MTRKKIVVMGTGYVGLPAALMWARSGIEVVGVDINENVVRAINERTMLINESELQDLMRDPQVQANLVAQTQPAAADIFVIAVPTPVDPLKKVADLSHVEAALAAICPFLQAGNLVILESTVPPKTCQNVVRPMIERLTGMRVPDDIKVAHCPERILPGNIFHEIVNNDRLIGGMDAASTRLAHEAYAAFVKGKLIETTDLVAELSKLMENTYRDVNIALANEFAQICEHLDVDPRAAIKIANRHPRVDILNPGIGVGGHCIPVDPWFLKEIAPYDSRIITAARTLNDEMPQRVAAKIRRAVKHLADPLIVALGATYKRNCEDMRASPAVEIVGLLAADGYRVRHCDPLVKTLAYASLTEACHGADLVVVLVNHDSLAKELAAHGADIMAATRGAAFVNYDDFS